MPSSSFFVSTKGHQQELFWGSRLFWPGSASWRSPYFHPAGRSSADCPAWRFVWNLEVFQKIIHFCEHRRPLVTQRLGPKLGLPTQQFSKYPIFLGWSFLSHATSASAGLTQLFTPDCCYQDGAGGEGWGGGSNWGENIVCYLPSHSWIMLRRSTSATLALLISCHWEREKTA